MIYFRTYYFYEFGRDEQHLAVVAAVNGGKVCSHMSSSVRIQSRTIARPHLGLCASWWIIVFQKNALWTDQIFQNGSLAQSMVLRDNLSLECIWLIILVNLIGSPCSTLVSILQLINFTDFLLNTLCWTCQFKI